MSNLNVRFALSGCVLAILAAAVASAAAQEPSVRAASTRAVELVPAGDAVRLTLTGASLDQIREIAVMDGRASVADISARTLRSGVDRLEIELQAGGRAPSGGGYTLLLTTARGARVAVAASILAVGVASAPAPAPVLRAISLDATTVEGAAEVRVTVTLDRPAPDAGLTVALETERPDVAAVPPSVTVAPGQTAAGFPVSVQEVGTATAVAVRASLGSDVVQAVLNVEPPLPVLVGFAVAAGTVTAGGEIEGTVQLDRPAPAGGTVVDLAAMPAQAVSLTPSVTVPPGQTEASFPIATADLLETTQVMLSATLGSDTRSATLTLTVEAVQPELLGFDIAALVFDVTAGGIGTVPADSQIEGTVQLDRPAPAGGTVVEVAAAPAQTISLAPSVTVPAGESKASFQIGTGNALEPTQVTVTVTLGPSTRARTMMVEPGLIRDLGIVEIETAFELVETTTPRRARLSVRAKNYGTAAMWGSFRCTIDGAEMSMSSSSFHAPYPEQVVGRFAQYPLPDLWRDFLPGQSVTVECSVAASAEVIGYGPPPGPDMDVSNDVASVSFEVPPVTPPDLRTNLVSIGAHACGGSGEPTDGLPLCLRASSQNAQGWILDTPFTVACTLDGQTLTSEEGDVIPGQFVSPVFDFGVKEAGSYTASCTVDVNNTVAETDESNNTATTTITVVEADGSSSFNTGGRP